jgi:hypothetical protein
MKSPRDSFTIRVPPISDDVRSSAMAATGTFVIGTICVLVTIRALAEWGSYGSQAAAAIGILGMAAVLVSVLRWSPSLDEESVRTFPRRHAAILFGLSIALGATVLATATWHGTGIGVLSTLCLLNVYLACWGYRSLFLLRRLVMFSALSWPIVARAVHEVVARTLSGPSDLIFRRLDSLGIASADDHPWRVLSAMTQHATVAVTGVVVLTLAASRLRLSVPAFSRLLIASLLAMLVHHALLMSAPIESYQQSWWAGFASGPILELLIAALFAVALFSSASALTTDEHASVPAADRDPEIFGAHNIATPVIAMRVCSLVIPTVLMTMAVIRS